MCSIVLFGGTFNPIHNGHIFMISECINNLKPDKFIVVPTNIPPHKQSSTNITSAVHRFNMCKLALDGIDGVEVSNYEINKPSVSYTYETIKHFKEVYNNSKINLLIGSDMMITFKEWNKYDKILNLSSLIVMPRQGADLCELKKYASDLASNCNANVKFIDSQVPAISSTGIRRKLISNYEINKLIPYKVKYYIDQYRLYKCEGSDLKGD